MLKLAAAQATLFNELEQKRVANTISADEYQSQLLVISQIATSTKNSAPVKVTVDTQSFVSALEKQNRMMDMPWARVQSQYEASFNAYETEARKTDADSISALQKEVYEKARDGALAPMEVMALMYLIFLPTVGIPWEASCRLLALLILRTPLDSRFLLHNWGAIARHMNPSDILENGHKMSTLQFPLFPPSTCYAINSKIFHAHQPQPQYNQMAYCGGSVPTVAVNPASSEAVMKLYRDESEDRDVMMGGSAPRRSRKDLEEEIRKLRADLNKANAELTKSNAKIESLNRSLQQAPAAREETQQNRGRGQGQGRGGRGGFSYQENL